MHVSYGRRLADGAVGVDPSGEVPVEGGSLAFDVRHITTHEDAPEDWTVLLETSMENGTDEDNGHLDYYYDALVVGGRAFAVSCFSADEEPLISGTAGPATVGFQVNCPPTGDMELILEDQLDRIDLTDAATPSEC